jgi:hypothetical protein
VRCLPNFRSFAVGVCVWVFDDHVFHIVGGLVGNEFACSMEDVEFIVNVVLIMW